MDHIFQNIPGWFKFAPAYDRAVAEASDGATFVEVGCWKGRSAAYLGVSIVNSRKRIALHCVDHWQDPKTPDLQATFEANLAPLVAAGLDLKMHVSESHLAAAHFPNQSLDFVWLDAGHRFDEVRADLLAWLPKMRPNSLIGGDDWGFLSVATAVRDVLGSDVQLDSADNWPWWWHRTKSVKDRRLARF
jgi:hypothetical protein